MEWVAISYSRDLLDPGIKPVSLASPALAGSFFTNEPLGKPQEQNSLLHNHNTTIRFRKYNLDVMLFFNPQSVFTFY